SDASVVSFSALLLPTRTSRSLPSTIPSSILPTWSTCSSTTPPTVATRATSRPRTAPCSLTATRSLSTT
ncbi:hypothetical protein BGZ52_013087, partial [Haplosporangium bisporale]